MRYEFEGDLQNIPVDNIKQTAEDLKPLNLEDAAAIKQMCHVLLLWALDCKKHGNGCGFPFDRPHVEFYRCLCILCEQLDTLQQKCIAGTSLCKCIARIIGDLLPVINDKKCRAAFREINKKQIVFDNLRQALSIALPGTTKGLNDMDENIDMNTIKKRVDQFAGNLVKTKQYQKSTPYQQLIKQIDKYREKLFCDPVKLSKPEDDVFIQPQRTNNILEQFFRGIRRSHRRATGNNSMHKKLQSINADAPLVKNLDNPDYLDIALGGTRSLEEALAHISQQEVAHKIREIKKDEAKLPRKIQ